MAACCAAYGVPLREPLKPDEPAEAQLTTRPSGSVSVMIVLLNVAWIQTSPCGTIRFSFFLRNSFFRLAGFAPAAGAAAASLGSFAMSSCRTFQDAGLNSPALRSNLTSKPDRKTSGPHSGPELHQPYLRAMVFFLAATAPLRGPLRVRAFVCVRWPRTGRFRRWRSPR